MSWLSEIFSSSASTIVDSVGNAIDKLVTSDDEKIQQGLEAKIVEAKTYLVNTDFKMTVDYFATLTPEQQEELTAKRAEARAFLKEQGL